MVLLLPVASDAEISKPNAPDDKARTKAILFVAAVAGKLTLGCKDHVG